MKIGDFINGVVFEGCGGVFIWRNVFMLLKHKMVRGVDWKTTAFFTSWGFFNIYYYASLQQWVSWTGGLNIVIANCFWLALAFKYRNK